MMKLFDSHCHLQDTRILHRAPQVIKRALNTGVLHFSVNGTSEKDWDLVREMSDQYPSVIPNFGIHPWFITERSTNWFDNLKGFLEASPVAAVGELGLDKGSKGRQIDFTDQVEVFCQQLQLAKELKKPASIHCVCAFGDLFKILKSMGPFPVGLILHSYLGLVEMVLELVKLGAYFSFSGFLMSMKENKAKKMLKAIPTERILLETDAPDALPTIITSGGNSSKNPIHEKGNASETQEDLLNYPENIHHILAYVASLLEMRAEQLADISFNNAALIFSYRGSKVVI